jgi:FlaA1/EpsC-like NDP-sugar epimerase
MDAARLIGRERGLFAQDIAENKTTLSDAISGARVLIYGGAGSIGKEVVAQVFRRNPSALHVIDISENNLVELVRDLRSSLGYIDGETMFLPIDMGGVETQAFLATQKPYDYVLNIAAMKHVRSGKDAYSLMRMIDTNVLNTVETLRHARSGGARKYFAVSTDKAKNPGNLMGATKRIMEGLLFERTDSATTVSTARFANVAFSDGSLLHGFRQRLLQRQPISAPRDIRRYFVTLEEAGHLCLASLVLGKEREIFFPKLTTALLPLSFSDIAIRFLAAHGYDAEQVDSEDEARGRVEELISRGKWPCYFFDSDTSGEKPLEEFYSDDDDVEFDRYADIGVIRSPLPSVQDGQRLARFLNRVHQLREKAAWSLDELTTELYMACPELAHIRTGKFLDERM